MKKLFFGILLISGCAVSKSAARSASIGPLGCAEQEISVSEPKINGGVHNWKAT